MKYLEDGQEKLFTADGCLMEEQGKLILLTETASSEVKVYPEGNTELHFCREIQPEGQLILLQEEETYVEYEIRIRGEMTEYLNDLWIRLELAGDRAELYLDGKCAGTGSVRETLESQLAGSGRRQIRACAGISG